MSLVRGPALPDSNMIHLLRVLLQSGRVHIQVDGLMLGQLNSESIRASCTFVGQYLYVQRMVIIPDVRNIVRSYWKGWWFSPNPPHGPKISN